MEEYTVSSFITGYHDISNFTESSDYPFSNACGDPSTNSTYASYSLSNTSGATCVIYFDFDFSSIPSNATIKSISIDYKMLIGTAMSSHVKSGYLVACSGTSEKGSSVSITGSESSSVKTMTDVGSWTVEDLKNSFCMKVQSVRGSMTFIGASLTVTGIKVTVTYTLPVLSVKRNGAWVKVKSLKKKFNGQWVEQIIDPSLFSTDTVYEIIKLE